MPALTAPLLGFVLGVVFAWLAAEDISRSGGGTASRSLLVVALFGGLVYTPAVAYFLAFSPDWSFAYVVDTERLPTAVDMALVLIDAGSVPAGFLAAARAAGARKAGVLLRIAAAPAVIALALGVATLRRLSVNATYAQFHGDFGTEAVTGSTLGYSLVWMAIVIVAGAAWTARVLRGIGAAARRD